MVKHTQTIRRQFADELLSVFDHFVILALKVLMCFIESGRFSCQWLENYEKGTLSVRIWDGGLRLEKTINCVLDKSCSWNCPQNSTLISSSIANPTKWSNTLKQFLGKLVTSVFDHFVGWCLALIWVGFLKLVS